MSGALRAIAHNTFREAVRNRVLYVIVAFAVIVILSSELIGLLALGEPQRIVEDLGLSAIQFFGVVCCVFLGVSLLSRELERRTAYFALGRPVSRAVFVVGKGLGLYATVLVMTGLMTLVFAAYSWLSFGEFPLPVLRAIALFTLEYLLVTTLALLSSAFTTPLLAALLTGTLVVIGHLSAGLKLLAKHPDVAGTFGAKLATVLYYVLPNLERFNLKAEAIYRDPVSATLLLTTLAYGLVYSLLVTILAVILFEKRDLSEPERVSARVRLVGAFRLVVVLLLVGLTASLAVRLDRFSESAGARHHSLYLPSGGMLRHVSLGFRTLLADMLFVWSIQYYAEVREDCWRALARLYDVITDLDPRWLHAYDIGAVIMSWEAHELEAGLALLDKGTRLNPEGWWLPFQAAMYARYTLHDRARTLERLEIASRCPDAPGQVKRWYYAFKVTAQPDSLEEALAFYLELESQATVTYEQMVAERHVRDIRVRLDLRRLQALVDTFKGLHGRPPVALEDLVRTGLIEELPLAPNGEAYRLDNQSGEVKSPIELLSAR